MPEDKKVIPVDSVRELIQWSVLNSHLDGKKLIIIEIEKEKMPLWKYTIMHPEATLTQKDKSLIKDWAGE